MTTTSQPPLWARCVPRTRRLFKLVILGAIEGFVLVAILLYFFQAHLIYHPRPYTPAVLQHLPTGLVALRDGDSLVGFYRPPRDGGEARHLWFCFGGNADQAMGWDAFADEHARAGTGFLLLEYPGYGACGGKPSPSTMLAANERAVALLAVHLGLDVAEVHRRAAGVGHSLGAAALLNYAVRHPLRRLILISPFTTMKDMARRTVGWPLCELLEHRFDNHARLAELAMTGLPPISIIHGDRDQLIPLAMGRELAAAHPGIHLSVIVGGGHNDVLDLAANEIRAAMGE